MLIACPMALAVAAAAAPPILVNLTPSVKEGIWVLSPLTGPVRVGDYVAACVPDSVEARRYLGPGRCPSGLEPVIKSIGAVEGAVHLPKDGPEAPMAADSLGRPLEAACRPPCSLFLPPGLVWLVGPGSPRSWDSRYYGPVNERSILARARLLVGF